MHKSFDQIKFISTREVNWYWRIGTIYKDFDCVWDAYHIKIVFMTYYNSFGIELIDVKATEIRLKKVGELIGILHQPF